MQSTDFVDDEYVIYRTAQQHMSYLVEFSDETDSKQLAKKTTRITKPTVPQANMIVPADDYDVVVPHSADDVNNNNNNAKSEKGDEQDQEAGLMSKGAIITYWKCCA